MKTNDITKEIKETRSDTLFIRIRPTLKGQLQNFALGNQFSMSDCFEAAMLDYLDVHSPTRNSRKDLLKAIETLIERVKVSD